MTNSKTDSIRSRPEVSSVQNDNYLSESVEVIATFGKNGVFPRIIKWGKRSYKILRVNLTHSLNEGTVKIYFFSVSDEANAFKLGFNSSNLRWWVEDHYSLNDVQT